MNKPIKSAKPRTRTTGSQCFAYNCFNYQHSIRSKEKRVSFHK